MCSPPPPPLLLRRIDGFGIDELLKLLSSPTSPVLMFELTIEVEGSCDGGDEEEDEDEGIITALIFSRDGVVGADDATW